MKALLIKDIINLKSYARTIMILVAFYVILPFVTPMDISFFSGMICILFVMMAITAFSYDNISKWDLFALSLPVSRKQMVMEKYLLSFIMMLTGGAVTSVLSIAATIFTGKTLTSDIFLVIYTLMGASLLYVSILLPFLYKFGVEKSRIIMFGAFLIPFGFLMLLKQIGFTISPQTLEFLLKLLPLAAIGIFIGSFFISYSIYKKQEF